MTEKHLCKTKEEEAKLHARGISQRRGLTCALIDECNVCRQASDLHNCFSCFFIQLNILINKAEYVFAGLVLETDAPDEVSLLVTFQLGNTSR